MSPYRVYQDTASQDGRDLPGCSISEAARRIGISKLAVRRLIRAGLLKAKHDDQQWIVLVPANLSLANGRTEALPEAAGRLSASHYDTQKFEPVPPAERQLETSTYPDQLIEPSGSAIAAPDFYSTSPYRTRKLELETALEGQPQPPQRSEQLIDSLGAKAIDLNSTYQEVAQGDPEQSMPQDWLIMDLKWRLEAGERDRAALEEHIRVLQRGKKTSDGRPTEATQPGSWRRWQTAVAQLLIAMILGLAILGLADFLFSGDAIPILPDPEAVQATQSISKAQHTEAAVPPASNSIR